MGEKIVIGPINKGLRTDRTAFVIDNDSFPTLVNAYQWRGRVKRKRGTSLLTRLTRFFDSTNPSYSSISSVNLVAGASLLFTDFNLEATSSLIPGTVIITDNTTAQVYTDDSAGTLIGGFGGTVNYATGRIAIVGGGINNISAQFLYYPGLPVLGIEDLELESTQFPGTIAFDKTYSYNVLPNFPYPSYDVSFYKNPAADPVNLPGYIPKANATPLTWNGQDYQQFWSVNYQGALWVTNGITIPFSITNIGMQFTHVTAVAAPVGNTVVITVTGPNLVVGDFVYANEFDPAIITGINYQTGYVIAGSAPGAITVEFPFATLAGPGGATTDGILQYLTNRSDNTKDGIRFYDGDPTNGSPTLPVLTEGHGWVNFSPPLSNFPFSIADLPPRQYYLITARMIVPFKDRLLFLGPVIGDSSGALFYLQDTIIYSQNGTPYYTSSFTTIPASGPNYPFQPVVTPPGYEEILVPDNQTATPTAWFEDSTGFGGFITAGLAQPITTMSTSEDVLIVGFSTIQTKVVYSGNDLVPFNFYVINSELGSASTFSTINMDRGVISRGTRGYTITNQVECQRIDLEIPDQVFEINLLRNGNERFCSSRDFINEWVYFTYPSNTRENNSIYRYPDQTLLYNYRDNSWAIFNESYTTYGSFRRLTGFTWQTVGNVYPSWNDWDEAWTAGTSTLLQEEVIAGNQQGFILFRDEGTGEGTSLFIQSVGVGTNIITSPDHNLSEGDYIMISGVIGSVGAFLNNKIFSVWNVTQDTFKLDPDPQSGATTYQGGGLITRLYVPQIQTKQFPIAWNLARKTRIGPQQYLFTKTTNAQITLLIFLSQNSADAYNEGAIVPAVGSINDGLIYSNVLFTCPESTNLGLTPANINLQTPTASEQAQIWHRLNTSLIGDTIQIGFTLSDTQMRALDQNGFTISQFAEIEFHGAILDVSPSQLLV